MISVVLGGARSSKAFKNLHEAKGVPPIIDAAESGTFRDFCQRAVRSTQIIQTVAPYVNAAMEQCTANDDMLVYFPETYLEEGLEAKITFLKVATAIEVALDLGLDVEALVVKGSEFTMSFMYLQDNWPNHWPKVLRYDSDKQQYE